MENGEQLFRREAGRIVAALTRTFGLENLALAEDVVQDVFCRALEVWKLRGVPENPSAWLMKAAKNRAIDLLRRERTATRYAPQLELAIANDWNPEAIADDELRMMFTCCDPRIAEEGQVALTLNLLAGFGVAEIAAAFFDTRTAVEKRIERAKKVLAQSGGLFELSEADLSARLSAVHRTLYLLFNEGYHGASKNATVRFELCREAMRMGLALLGNPLTATPVSYALCALMHLHAARLPARIDGDGELVCLAEQDRARWDRALIAKGSTLLERSAAGEELSPYHLEAGIAFVHSSAPSPQETDWARIVWLYDTLMATRPSPVVALNRAIAIAQAAGPERGIEEIAAIRERERLASYPFLPAALGELELRLGHRDAARSHFESAVLLARNPTERRFLQSRLLSTYASLS